MQTVQLISSDTTYVSQKQSGANFYYSDMLLAGVSGGKDEEHSCSEGEYAALLKFGTVSLLPRFSTIVGARLHLFCGAADGQPACGRYALGVYPNLEDFDGRSATWTNRPRTEPLPEELIQFMKPDIPGYVFCDITELASKWAAPGASNYGVTLKTNRSHRQLFLASSRHSQNPPFISLEYYTDLPPHPEGYLDSEFSEQVFHVSEMGQECFSPTVYTADTGLTSFFVQNTSECGLMVNLQISPDGNAYLNDAQKFLVPEGGLSAATPYYFAKYNRVRLTVPEPYCHISAKIWCQIQTKNYRLN